MGKAAIITAIVLMLLGTITFVSVLAVQGFDFSKFITESYQTNTHQLTDSFHSIRIDTDISKITILPSPDGTCRVECLESDKLRHNVRVEDDILKISQDDQRRWYDYIGIFNRIDKLTLYIPSCVYNNLSINSDTGDISISKDFSFDSISIHATTADVTCEASATNLLYIRLTTGDLQLSNLHAGSISLSSNTGDMNLRNITCDSDLTAKRTTGKLTMESVTCGSLTLKADTGDTKLTKVCASGSVSIQADTGDVTFDHCDGGDITVTTDTGDVTGTLLTGKLFSGSTDTGHLRLPSSTPGGQCNITTDTGDIEITVP